MNEEKNGKTAHRRMIWEGIVEWADYSDNEIDEKGRRVPHLKAAPHRITIDPTGWLRFWIGLPNDSNPGSMQYFSIVDVGEVEEEHIARQAIRDLVAKLESAENEGLFEENRQLRQENLQLKRGMAEIIKLNGRIKQGPAPGVEANMAVVCVPTTLAALAKPSKMPLRGTEAPSPARKQANPKPKLSWSEKLGRMVIDGEVPNVKVPKHQSYQEHE